MRKLFVLVIVGIIHLQHGVTFAGLNPSATIEWSETEIDLGEVPYGEPVVAEFGFKNPGMIPLIISDVKPSFRVVVP